jgi:hypothetical protein
MAIIGHRCTLAYRVRRRSLITFLAIESAAERGGTTVEGHYPRPIEPGWIMTDMLKMAAR